MNSEITSSIAPFAANSLTTSTYSWLHQEAWQEEHWLFFRDTQVESTGRLARHPFVHPRRLTCSHGGRWVLAANELVSSINVNILSSKFSSIQVFLGRHRSSWVNERDALGLFLTGLNLMKTLDRLTLVVAGESDIDAISGFGWTNGDHILVPGSSSRHTVFNISSDDWLALDEVREHRETLRYLERRRERRKPVERSSRVRLGWLRR